MSGTYGKSDDAQSIDVIHRALDLGINFIDSSDMYGWGHNEELLGRALKGRRSQAVLTTKFGQVQSPDGKGNLVDGSPAYVQRACDASLKRLGVDVIDLYYQHRVDPKVPIEDTVGAMARLIEQGKVRYLGLSEAAPATIRRAHAVHALSAVQSEYSLLYRNPAEETLPTDPRARHHLRRVFAARPRLSHGTDPGSERPSRRRPPPPASAGSRTRTSTTTSRSSIGSSRSRRRRACSPASSRWRGSWRKATTSCRSPGPSAAAISRRTWARLDPAEPSDLERINEAMPAGAAAGTRYPEPQMKGVQI